MTLLIFLSGLVIIALSLLIPHSSASYAFYFINGPEAFDHETRNWWMSYLVMIVGAIIALYGAST
jgi:hypothetical protein